VLRCYATGLSDASRRSEVKFTVKKRGLYKSERAMKLRLSRNWPSMKARRGSQADTVCSTTDGGRGAGVWRSEPVATPGEFERSAVSRWL